MNQQTIKTIKKFIRCSGGTAEDIKDFKRKFKKMNWLDKTKELARMREILRNAV